MPHTRWPCGYREKKNIILHSFNKKSGHLGLVEVSPATEHQGEDGADAPPAAAMARMDLLRAGVRAQRFLHLLAPNLADQRVERLVDVVTQCGRCLEEGTAELVGQVLALLGGHAALRLQVHLVGDQYQRNVLRETHSCDKLSVLGGLLEAVAVGDRVANDETFATAHVLVPHGRELHLAGGIKDIEESGLVVDDRLLLVGVLCGGRVKGRAGGGGGTHIRGGALWQAAATHSPIVGSW